MQINWNRHTLTVGSMALRTYCQPGWHLNENWSRGLSDMDLWYVCSGRGQMQLRDRTIALRAGLCVWMRPGGRYVVTQNLEHRLVVNAIHFDLHDRSGKQCDADRMEIPEIFHVSDHGYFDASTRHLIDWISSVTEPSEDETPPEFKQTILKAILMELLYHAKQKQLTGTALYHQEKILRAASLIRENLARGQSVTELATTCGYSQGHFTRTFKQVIGCSPQQYRVQERMKEAGKLLLESSCTISQIADILGYPDVYFFSRQFKQKMGVNPKQYRTLEY